MHPVTPCNTYHARICPRRELVRTPDGRSVFKVYFVDVIGRSNPARTEWDKCSDSKDAFLGRLPGAEGLDGVGFVTAFPHITKAFRYGPENETVVNVRAWSTPSLEPFDLSCADGYVQFACLAEALIAADEYRFWAEADTVEDYLSQWSDCTEAPVCRHDKLLEYWKRV